MEWLTYQCLGVFLQNMETRYLSFFDSHLRWLWIFLASIHSLTALCDVGIPNFVPRSEWGAQHPRIFPKMEPLSHPVQYVVVSYFTPDVTNDKMALQVIQQKHMDAGQPDIQSNFLIGKNGTIYEGRGWLLKPSKSIDFPDYYGRYLEISYIGNFNEEPVSHPVYKATWDIFRYGIKKKYITEDLKVLSEGGKLKGLA